MPVQCLLQCATLRLRTGLITCRSSSHSSCSTRPRHSRPPRRLPRPGGRPLAERDDLQQRAERVHPARRGSRITTGSSSSSSPSGASARASHATSRGPLRRPRARRPRARRGARDCAQRKIRNVHVDRGNTSRLPQGRVVKDCYATNLAPHLAAHFPEVPLILLLRHPGATAHSAVTLGWKDGLEAVFDQGGLITAEFAAQAPVIGSLTAVEPSWTGCPRSSGDAVPSRGRDGDPIPRSCSDPRPERGATATAGSAGAAAPGLAGPVSGARLERSRIMTSQGCDLL